VNGLEPWYGLLEAGPLLMGSTMALHDCLPGFLEGPALEGPATPFVVLTVGLKRDSANDASLSCADLNCERKYLGRLVVRFQLPMLLAPDSGWRIASLLQPTQKS
jgi:hypothetical protein